MIHTGVRKMPNIMDSDLCCLRIPEASPKIVATTPKHQPITEKLATLRDWLSMVPGSENSANLWNLISRTRHTTRAANESTVMMS